MRDATVVCFAGIDWAFNHQIPQEIALGLAGRGNRVLFIENTGARAASWRDLPRLWLRLRNWLSARGGTARAGERIDVFSPVLLPLPYTRPAVSINSAAMLNVIRRWLRGQPEAPLVVITYLPTPAVRKTIEALEPDVVIYYRVDRMSESSPAARRIIACERQFLADADLVLATAPQLYDDVVPHAARVEVLESGVQCDQFAEARRRRHEPHAAFAGIDGPVAGFVGSLRTATDLALLDEAASLAPEITFVLAGPHMADLRALTARPNVRLAGAIPHAEVPRYVARFDVGLLPYVLDPFTIGIMPVKLKEYLAAGVPVVATELPAVRAFAAKHPGLVTFAGDARGFVAAVRAAIAENTPEAAARRLAIASSFDWSRQIARMADLLDDLLDRRARAAS